MIYYSNEIGMKAFGQDSPLWEKGKDHVPVATRNFFYTCGCGGIKPKVNSILVDLGIKNIDAVKTTVSRTGRAYAEAHKLYSKCPALRKHTHAILVGHKTKDCVDLLDKDYEQVLMKARRLINENKV